MTFRMFYLKLRHRYGANKNTAYRLWQEGARSADDAHRTMFEAGELPGVVTESDFSTFCHRIGADFVLDNIGYDGALFSV